MDVLAEAQRQGFVGPGPVEPHLIHAWGFARTCGQPPPGPALDLGSGAGLPGLPLALAWPGSEWTLLDANQRRANFLRAAADRLGVGPRVTVTAGRAEDLAHDARLRASFALVVSRGFGPPPVTAECAAGFLRVGGILVVSEPPEPVGDRWPDAGLAVLAMRVRARAHEPEAPRFAVIEQYSACPDRYPRRVGVPAKRPLF